MFAVSRQARMYAFTLVANDPNLLTDAYSWRALGLTGGPVLSLSAYGRSRCAKDLARRAFSHCGLPPAEGQLRLYPELAGGI